MVKITFRTAASVLAIILAAVLITIASRKLTLRPDGFQSFENIKFGINYYSSGKLWRDFWTNFSEDIIDRDFRKIRELDFNLVRVFIYHDLFVNDETRESSLKKLRSLINIAQKHRIQLIITTFDWAKPYKAVQLTPEKSRDFKLGLTDIVQIYSQHPAIYAWDIKNEPDHDFDTDGRSVVLTGLNNAVSYLHAKWPGLRLTIGWLQLFEDVPVNQGLDFLSFHHFPEQGSLKDRARQFRRLFPEKSIFLEELGYSTFYPEAQPQEVDNNLERKQDRFLSQSIREVIHFNLNGLLFWSYIDHAADVGPKRPPTENGFGILRKDSSPKIFAKTISSGIYPNRCDYAEDNERALGICVSASGNDSRLHLSFSKNADNGIFNTSTELNRGISCFCFDSLVQRTLMKLGYKPRISHRGLVTLSGGQSVPPGQWAQDDSK